MVTCGRYWQEGNKYGALDIINNEYTMLSVILPLGYCPKGCKNGMLDIINNAVSAWMHHVKYNIPCWITKVIISRISYMYCYGITCIFYCYMCEVLVRGIYMWRIGYNKQGSFCFSNANTNEMTMGY